MTPRRAHRVPPRLAKPLLGVALTMLSLLAPADTGLYGPLQAHLGSAEAAAQLVSVQPGNADACPTIEWTADDDVCLIEVPACPNSPFDSSRRMQPSTEFPELCEETVTLADDPAVYAACAGPPTLEGFAVKDNGAACRVLQLRTCELGTRIDSELCRSTIRRSWTCPDSTIPGNQFNTCYTIPTAAMGATHPACGTGAPDIVVVDCSTYVGNDFVDPPDPAACGSYDTGSTSAIKGHPANTYWCEFDPSLLKTVCHGAAAPAAECASSVAMCLKRGSDTGGCATIAHTILCRELQADYADPNIDLLADHVREQDCEPCLILPFEPVPPQCPEDTYEIASPYIQRVVHHWMHRYEQGIERLSADCRGHYGRSADLSPACLATPTRCDTPSPGNPVWHSTHFSDLAVVNSSVVVRVHDVPVTYREDPTFDILTGDLNWGRISEYAEFPGSGLSASGQLARTFERPDPTLVTSDVRVLGNSSRECVVSLLPVFKLVVEELWPDRPADVTAITTLFGASALDWWTDLAAIPGARERRTEAHGLRWWPSLTSDEQAERVESLQTKIDCKGAQGVDVWCRWVPTRSGYFRLKAAGAWQMSIGNRGWEGTHELQTLDNDVAALTDVQRQRAFEILDEVGCGRGQPVTSSCALTPAALGLNDTLTGILPTDRDPEDLYRLAGDGHRYPKTDLRVTSPYSIETGKYTETLPFGIQVHEVRVSTVTPSR